MTVTLTSNYKETLNTATVEMIDNLQDELYDLAAMLEFIDENSEADFVEHYEEYVRCGEAIGFEAVDALIAESGIDAVENCDERYHGCHHCAADFAEEFYNSTMHIPDGLIIDWEAMWDRNLYYDFTACNDGSTYCPVHIFADN